MSVLPKPIVFTTVAILESEARIVIRVVRLADWGENEISDGDTLELLFETAQIDCKSFN